MIMLTQNQTKQGKTMRITTYTGRNIAIKSAFALAGLGILAAGYAVLDEDQAYKKTIERGITFVHAPDATTEGDRKFLKCFAGAAAHSLADARLWDRLRAPMHTFLARGADDPSMTGVGPDLDTIAAQCRLLHPSTLDLDLK